MPVKTVCIFTHELSLFKKLFKKIVLKFPTPI